ncbi:MAG: toxin-antitoxin system YwqK family antitoxin [Tepidisphaerales bacterium]
MIGMVGVSAVLGAALGAAAPGVVEEKYPNGTVKSRITMGADGKKSGPYTLSFENGKVQEQGIYRDGELDGTQTINHPTGKVKLKQEYKAGQLNGSLAEFDEKGIRVRTAEYRLGQLNGINREYAGNLLVSEKVYVAGVLVYPRSQQMLTQALTKIRTGRVESRKLGPEDKGIPSTLVAKTTEMERQAAAKLLMEYRELCGVPVPAVQLDPFYNAQAEAATQISEATGQLAFSPQNPGWPPDQYEFAKAACPQCGLFTGNGGLTAAVRLWMSDSSEGNIKTLASRRLCLNPALQKVGFALSPRVASMQHSDTSRMEIPDWDFIALPAPGFYPVSHFAPTDAWSVSVNEAKYKRPAVGAVQVTLSAAVISMKDGQIKPAGESLKLNFMGVDAQTFGTTNCIIFRPERVAVTPGAVYLVEISGLKDASDKPTKLRYVVEFCRL